MEVLANAVHSMSQVRYPDGNVLLRSLGRDYPVVAHGNGVYLYDSEGRRYLDGSSGAFVASVGHGNHDVAHAIYEQLSKVGYVNGKQFTSEPTETLATMLAQRAPAGLDRSAFLCSGSEAVEAALKFARQLQVERGDHGRGRVIARAPSYHGNTLYALSVSGRPHYKTWYGPMMSDVITVSSPYPYRSPVEDYAQHGATWFAEELERTILDEGPETIAAFIAEPVIGSSAGAAVPPPGYFEAVTEICRRHGILTIADEVLCGVGRTGAFFTCSQVGFEPDLLVLGKGVGGGCAPLSVMMTRTAYVDEMRDGSGGFMHAQTYMQAPFVTAAGVATLRYIDEHRLVDNAADTGLYLIDQLEQRLLGLPYVGSVQGLGLLAGIEFVADKRTKEPRPRREKFAERLTEALFRAGLIVWPNTGQADGTRGDLIMIGPPLVIDRRQVDELVDTLEDVIRNEGRK